MVSKQRAASQAMLAFAVAAVVLLSSVVAVAIKAWFEQRRNPPTCVGIGFGCSPAPLDEALLVAVLVGVPATVLSAAAVAAGSLLARIAPRAGQVVMWLPAV